MANNILDLLAEFTAGMTKQADDESGSTKPVTEGARGSENEADIKKFIPGNNVNSAAPNTDSPAGAGTNAPQASMGVKSSPTGENVPSTKNSKDDPGTSHVAKAGGEKFASIDAIINGGNELLADMAVLAKSAAFTPKKEKQPAVETLKPAATGENKTPVEKKPENSGSESEVMEVKKAEYEKLASAAAQWEEMVGYLAGQDATQELFKQAGITPTTNKTPTVDPEAELTKFAAVEADRLYKQADAQTTDLVDFLLGTLQKSADDGSVDPALLAALQGGGGDPTGGAGGPPMDPSMDPTGGAGGPPPMDPSAGGGAPDAGGGGLDQIDPKLLMALIQALQQQGVGGGDLGGADAALGGGDDAPPSGDPSGGGDGPKSDGDGDEGGEKEDAIDSAQAAAAAEPGSDDETKGAKKEAQWSKADMQKAASLFAKFVKKASEVSAKSKPKTNKK